MLGHSLGEYSALASSYKITLSDCAKLLKLRGDLMHRAINPNESGMAALIGLDSISIQNIIDEVNLDVQIANDNSPIQVVISGMINNIDKSRDIFLKNGVKKFVKLNVSAAFHSNLMLEAQNIMRKYIDETIFSDSSVSIISNFSSKISNNSETIKDSLINQMANKVRWKESINELEINNEKNLIEIGPGKVLSGLVKRITSSFEITSIDQMKDLELFK
jgi:[acyl-carrier-protein] S-malonyltransferase